MRCGNLDDAARPSTPMSTGLQLTRADARMTQDKFESHGAFNALRIREAVEMPQCEKCPSIQYFLSMA